MVIILILVVLWGLVLAPSAVRKFKRQASNQSIDSFHHSLHTLERSGPKIVEPAYRLGGGGSVSVIDPVTNAERPRLVLLRPPGQEEETAMSDYYDSDFEDFDDDRSYGEAQAGYDYGVSRPSDSHGRRMAARRRRNVLLGLAVVVLVTGLLGLFASFFFVLTVVSALALVGYVGLMSYAVLTGMVEVGHAPVAERHVAHATAWDDEPAWDEDDRWEASSYDQAGDGWWDEPRRAVGR
jgi:hypothetical protein